MPVVDEQKLRELLVGLAYTGCNNLSTLLLIAQEVDLLLPYSQQTAIRALDVQMALADEVFGTREGIEFDMGMLKRVDLSDIDIDRDKLRELLDRITDLESRNLALLRAVAARLGMKTPPDPDLDRQLDDDRRAQLDAIFARPPTR